MEPIEDHILAKIALEKKFFTTEQLREAYRELGKRMATGKAPKSGGLFAILRERGMIAEAQYQEVHRIATWLMGQAGAATPNPPVPIVPVKPVPAPEPRPVKPVPARPLKPVAKKPAPKPKVEAEEGDGTLDVPQVSEEDMALASEQTLIEQPRVKPQGPMGGSTRLAAKPKTTPPEVVEASKDPDYVFDDFVLTAELGKGGMGVVWKAWQTSLKRWVAVKFLNSKDETELKRFFQEARTVLSLDHPNIARLFKLGKYQEMYYLVMEFVDGRALQHLLGQLDDRTAAQAVRDAAIAIHVAHEQGIIHRDIKPQNIMICDDGHVYVMDFGLARHNANESRHTVSGMVLGTPSFMSPEQAEGKFKNVDKRSDVCSLGSTLYALMAGRPPFVGRTVMDTLYKVVHTDPVPISHFNAHVSKELEKVILCAMRKEPPGRYQTAKELADDLDRFLKGEPVKGRTQVGRSSQVGRTSQPGRTSQFKPPIRRR